MTSYNLHILSISRWLARLLPGGIVLVLLSACSGIPLQSSALLQSHPAEFLHPVELNEIRFFAQKDYQCGPAALAMVLDAQGIRVKPDDLVDKVYLPERQGSLQVEMIAAARDYQLIPYVIQKSMTDLLKELQAGNPVLVLQNLGLDWVPVWHYAVVIGYDMQRDQILLHSGMVERHVNSFELFERTWHRAGYWGVVILPADKLPATANAHDYLSSVNRQEKLGRLELASRAYRRAAKKWPNDKNVLMALANNDYARGKTTHALDTFTHIVRRWPDFPPALNNLAYLLMEQGKYDEARRYAHKAVSLGEGHSKSYRETLREINKRAGYE